MNRTNLSFAEEIGIVEKIKSETAHVRIRKKPQCNGCNACGFGAQESVLLPAIRQIECQIGDCVVVQIPQQNRAKTSVFLWLIPMVLLILGAVVGYLPAQSEAAAIIGSFGALSVGGVLWAVCEKMARKRGFSPRIVRICRQDEIEKREE